MVQGKRRTYLLQFEIYSDHTQSQLAFAYLGTIAHCERTAIEQATVFLCKHQCRIKSMMSVRAVPSAKETLLLPMQQELINLARQRPSRTAVFLRPSLHV